MEYTIPLVSLHGDEFTARLVREVKVQAADEFEALFLATDTITDAEASSVFATFPVVAS